MSAVVLVAWLLVSSPPPPPALMGTDDVPLARVVDAVPVAELLAVLGDRDRHPIHRARAARLLGLRAVDDSAIDVVLREVRAAERGPLAAQLTLALADRAAARRDRGALMALGDEGLDSADVDVARAGVLVWWRLGDGAARDRLLEVASAHPDPRVRGACRGRLRRWPPARRDEGGTDMLDPAHGGPPPAR